MNANQQKALLICNKANVRPYCRMIEFFIYDLENPEKDGDYTERITKVLGNAAEYLISISDGFKNFPKITPTFIRHICYGKKKTMTVVKKSTNQKIKVVIKSKIIQVVDWPKNEVLLWR